MGATAHTPEAVGAWIDAFQSGLTGKQVADLFGVPWPTVYKRLRAAGAQRPIQAKPPVDLKTKRAHHAAWHRSYRAKNGKSIKVKQALLKNEWKNKPCSDCGKRFPSVAMEFDHVRGEKKFRLSHNAYRSPELIKSEIDKCDVVCVLCHRERTHSRYVYSNSLTGRRKRALRDRVDALKVDPCVLCNNSYKPWQMDFDHLDPGSKIDKVSNLIRRRTAWKAIVEEISKCRLLCALCHRLHTEGVKWPV